MKKILFCTCMTAAFLTISQGSLATGMTLTLDNPYQTVLVGHSERIYLSGTIWIPENCQFDFAALELPGLEGTTDYLFSFQWDDDFVDYMYWAELGQSYTGVFGSFDVSGEPAGDYFYSGALQGPDTVHSEFVVYCKENQQMPHSAAQAYGIAIKETGEPSVPGPAAAIPMALGLAASALRRRNKKKE